MKNNKEQIEKLAAEIVELVSNTGPDQVWPASEALTKNAIEAVTRKITLALLGLEASYAQEKIAETSNATACARSLELVQGWIDSTDGMCSLQKQHAHGEYHGRVNHYTAELVGPRVNVSIFRGTDLADALAQASVAIQGGAL